MAGVLTRPPGRLSDKAPPSDPSDPGEGGGGGDWALLTVAKNAMVAYLIQGRLAQQGIDAVLDSTNASPGAWLHPFGDQASPVRVFVRRSDLNAASLTLHEVDQPEPTMVAVGNPPGRTAVPVAQGAGRLRELRWLRLLVGVVISLLAAAALSGLIVLGPCVSHWFCT
jgi:hypothetical protein